MPPSPNKRTRVTFSLTLDPAAHAIVVAIIVPGGAHVGHQKGTHGMDRTETGDAGLARRSASQPYLHLVLDGARPRAGGARWALAGAGRAAIGRGEARGGERSLEDGRWTLSVALADGRVSRRHVALEPGGGAFVVRDLEARNGTFVDGERIEPGASGTLRAGALLRVGRSVLLWETGPARPREPAFVDTADLAPPHPDLATLSPALADRFADLARVVTGADTTVLVRGPTGSGKEIAARAIHELVSGARGRRGPFVAVNCAAIPPTLVEAELFGAARGAYSGATEERPGLVRAAHGGTLFLDEIADLRPESQAALLRVLETREVLSVGTTRPVPVDVVVVAATHRDLAAMIAAGELRADLHARLAGYELVLPSLADRRADLGLLVARLLAAHTRYEGSFSDDAALAMARYGWPYNVRELKAALAQAVARAGDGPIGLQHLPENVRSPATPPAAELEPAGVRSARDERLRARLEELLVRHAGNVASVARELGKHRKQVQRWLERVDLDADDFRRD
jgi:DNA-binding NtrC family response regulator